MSELALAYKARSYSSGTHGRAICNARNHHWIADDSGGDEVGAGELFCASIAACAVNMVTRIAREEKRALASLDVDVELYRDFAKPPDAVTIYDAARVHFEIRGASRDDAEYLVKVWKSR